MMSLGVTRLSAFAQRLIEPGLRPRLGPSEPLLDLREHLLDRRVVRAVRRQRPHSRPHPLDRRGHSGGQEARWGFSFFLT